MYFDTLVKIGVIDYLTFNNIIIVRSCSKYLNEFVILPNTASFTINQTQDIDNIKPILLKYGSYVKRINLSHITSTTKNIDLICHLCQNLQFLEIMCVNITKYYTTACIDLSDKILTEEYLNSEQFKNLQKLIVYDSYIDENVSPEKQYIIDKKTTYSVCNECGEPFANLIFIGNFWHDYLNEDQCICESCSISKKCVESIKSMIDISKQDTYICCSCSIVTHWTVTYSRHTMFGIENIERKNSLPDTKKIHCHEKIHKKYQTIKPIKTYMKKIPRYKYRRQNKN